MNKRNVRVVTHLNTVEAKRLADEHERMGPVSSSACVRVLLLEALAAREAKAVQA